jgi:hypothetical protein
MATPPSLPDAFDPNGETDTFLERLKKNASTKFSWKQKSLEAAKQLAYWLYVFGKEDDTLEVCRFLGTYQFAGNFSLWSWVERTLALQARIARQRDQHDELAECVRRITAAGFVSSRLHGSLLEGHLEGIQRAVAAGDKTSQRNWSLVALGELCMLIELGGSDTWPTARLEQEFATILAQVRALLKVG